VLSLLAQRLTDKEIAARLVLSPLTVKKHMQRIYHKLAWITPRSGDRGASPGPDLSRQPGVETPVIAKVGSSRLADAVGVSTPGWCYPPRRYS